MIKMMLLAGTGGFVGTCLRFLTGKICVALGAAVFPWATLVGNVVGSFIIGVLFGVAERTTLITAAMNALLITGFCGGFTTFSSFSHDMLGLIEQRQYLYFVLYAALSFVLGFTVVFSLLGLFAGTLGSLVIQYRTWVNIICGIMIIFFGFNFTV